MNGSSEAAKVPRQSPKKFPERRISIQAVGLPFHPLDNPNQRLQLLGVHLTPPFLAGPLTSRLFLSRVPGRPTR